MLNPENVGFRVLTKSMDCILEAVKRKKKVIPIPVIYVYYSQFMPKQQCCSIMSMHTFKCEGCIWLEHKTPFRYTQTHSELFIQQNHTKLKKKERTLVYNYNRMKRKVWAIPKEE